MLNRIAPELESIRKVSDLYFFLRLAGLTCALLVAPLTVHGQGIAWPQFRGPDSNPVVNAVRLCGLYGLAPLR
jgi:hypothetical protein